jgi:hypothetical protein
MTGTHCDDWRMCACERSIAAHFDADPDPAGGIGCGMAWRPCVAGSNEIEERHITEVQPGGHLRQDVPAGLALPNHQMSSEENAMVGPHAAAGTARPRAARTGRRVVRELPRFELLDPAAGPAGGNPVTVRALLRWISTDPHTVAIAFRPGRRGEVTWLIDRDLLADGMRGPAGLGDVSILPDLRSDAHRELVLSSPDGQRGFRFPVAAVVAFLDRAAETGGCAR